MVIRWILQKLALESARFWVVVCVILPVEILMAFTLHMNILYIWFAVYTCFNESNIDVWQTNIKLHILWKQLCWPVFHKFQMSFGCQFWNFVIQKPALPSYHNTLCLTTVCKAAGLGYHGTERLRWRKTDIEKYLKFRDLSRVFVE
jgi:hypothetical protein